MWVESQPGHGSRFHFTAQFGIAAHPPAESAPAPITAHVADSPASGRKLDILVAEDNAINQQLLRMILQKKGHRVVIAANGREALEAFESQSFDLVLMDVQMPEMDGIQATAAIRNLERGTGRAHRIIALTANAMKGDEERCLGAGMDGYLSKPIQMDRLEEVLADAGRKSASETPQPQLG